MSNEYVTVTMGIEDESGENRPIKLSRIPRQLWDEFTHRCAKHLPSEEKEVAWSRVFATIIQSEFITKEVVIPYMKAQRENEYTFLLAGIPLAARDAFEMYASQANLTPDLLIALMYQAAMESNLHILNMRPPQEHTGYHVIVTTGITDETWAAWSKIAIKLQEVTGEEIEPEALMGHIFERALWGNITISSNDPNDLGSNIGDFSKQTEAAKQNHANMSSEVKDLQAKMADILQRMGEDER